MGYQKQFTEDNWHREVKSLVQRDAIRTRRWGMRVTLYVGADAGEYILEYGQASTNRQDNANWKKVANIGDTWGGGGSSVNFVNGIGELSPGNVGLGGSLINQSTFLNFDVGGSLFFNGFNSNTVEFGMSDSDSSSDVLFGPDSILLSVGDLSAHAVAFESDLPNSLWTSTRIDYRDEYLPDYTDFTLPSWGNVKSHLGGQAVGSTVTSPTGAQDGYVLAWNNGTLEYDLVPPGASTFQNGIGESSPGVVELGINPLTTDATIDTTAATLYIGDQTPGSEILFVATPGNTSIASNFFTFGFSGGSSGYAVFEDADTGIQYSSSSVNRANWTDVTLVDRFYAAHHIGGQAVDTTITSPASGQNGFVVSWNNSTLEYELIAPGGITANNGLTKTGSNIALGGALVANTTITGGGGAFDLILGTPGDPLDELRVQTDNGFSLITAGGFGRFFIASTGDGEWTTTGTADIVSNTPTSSAIRLQRILRSSSTSNDVAIMTEYQSRSLFGAAAGFGMMFQYNLSNSASSATIDTAATDEYYWADATDNANYANYRKQMRVNNVMTDVMTILTSSASGNIFITLSGHILMPNLPTASAGLPANTLWRNAGVLNIT